jgi:DNA-binding response OmpR family regulator
MRILLADDDADMVDITAYALRREGFTVLVAVDGLQAFQRWRSDQPDLVLLDVAMPRLNGFEVCRRIRQVAATPIIMLTGASDEEHVLQGFRFGADDYVTKPFSPKQLAVRIRAVLRRSRADAACAAEDLRIGEFIFDTEAHQVQVGNRRVQLTPLEFRIFYLLAANAGRVVSFRRLVEYAWGYDGGDAALLKTHVSHLRKKLGLRRGRPEDIVVVHGVGYSLALARPSPEGSGVTPPALTGETGGSALAGHRW